MYSKSIVDRRNFLTTAVVLGTAVGQSAAGDAMVIDSDSAETDEIWDLHGHLAGGTGRTPEARMERLLEYAERMGVSKVCIYMGMTFSYDPSPEELRQQNDEILQALQVAGPRALGFVYLNPKHVEASLGELERCVANGPMVGVKLWVASRASDRALDRLIERATELEAVIFQHTWMKVSGNLPGESTPADLVELAARHPDARLICGHTGGDWELGIRAIKASKQVAVELGGGEPTAGFTEMAVRELGPERVIYGSDVPGRGFGTQLAKVYGAGLEDRARKLILAGNLKRLLQPIMHRKGTA